MRLRSNEICINTEIMYSQNQMIVVIKMIDVVTTVIRNETVKLKQNVNLIVGMMIMIIKMM
ncbi:hypothetical protein [Agathobacter rectalis]|uniref:hypothetical protein n=1 Tax=Agathobacter rectalis TaxID=39491 RepID=UPI0011C20EA6|nr:hypothetical protein [Agathobacter rectalis]